MNLSREILCRSDKVYLLKGKKNQADVYIIEQNGEKIVIKDYINKKGWVKIYGKILSRLEYNNYKKVNRILRGECFPKVFCMPDDYSLAMEYIDGKTIDMVENMEEYCFAVKELDICIKRCSRQNIFHLDLRKRGNIIIKNNRVYLIDLASMMILSYLNPLIVLKPILKLVDYSSVLKWKEYICSSHLTENEIKKLKIYGWFRALWIFNKPKIPKI